MADDPKIEQVRHIRRVHFSLLAVCLALVSAAIVAQNADLRVAVVDLTAIQRVITKWELAAAGKESHWLPLFAYRELELDPSALNRRSRQCGFRSEVQTAYIHVIGGRAERTIPATIGDSIPKWYTLPPPVYFDLVEELPGWDSVAYQGRPRSYGTNQLAVTTHWNKWCSPPATLTEFRRFWVSLDRDIQMYVPLPLPEVLTIGGLKYAEGEVLDQAPSGIAAPELAYVTVELSQLPRVERLRVAESVVDAWRSSTQEWLAGEATVWRKRPPAPELFFPGLAPPQSWSIVRPSIVGGSRRLYTREELESPLVRERLREEALALRDREEYESLLLQVERRTAAVAFNGQEAFVRMFRLRDWRTGSYEESFRALASATEAYEDLPIQNALAVLLSEARRSGEPVQLFGAKIPGAYVLQVGFPVLLMMQVYLCLHLLAFRRWNAPEPPRFPWIGLYTDPYSRAVTNLSWFAPPMTVVIVAYVLGAQGSGLRVGLTLLVLGLSVTLAIAALMSARKSVAAIGADDTPG